MDELTKTIFLANKERRTLNLDDIRNICYYVIKRQGYGNINDVIINDKYRYRENGKLIIDNNRFGFYQRLNNSLYYFYDNILDYSLKNAEDFKREYNIDSSTVDILNYYFLTFIIHELAHLRQQHIVDSLYYSFEKKLLSIFNELRVGNEIYDNNTRDIITEVNARNVSYITTLNVYRRLPKNFFTQDDKLAFQIFTLKQLLLSNYAIDLKTNTVSSPSERIGSQLTNEILEPLDINDYKELIYNTNFLTLFKKLMFGLPISCNEYAYGNLLIDELNSGVKINAIKKLQKRLK